MKLSIKLIVTTFFFFFITSTETVEAQFFKKLRNKIEKKVDEKIDDVIEGKKEVEISENKKEVNKKEVNEKGVNIEEVDQSTEDFSNEDDLKTFKISSKFDFVPGDKLLFFDDFQNDFIGDFPSKWDTNAGGEVVTINDSDEKWFELITGYSSYYEPVFSDLPEEYTIEFDVLVSGIDEKTSSVAQLIIFLVDGNKHGDKIKTEIPFCQYTPIGIGISNSNKNADNINNTITADIREAVINKPHISIAVNKARFRLWVNEKKYIDIPKLVPAIGGMKKIRFNLHSFKDGKEHLFIRNVKILEGGEDLRKKLIAEGRISTNGILFDSGSATIQPQSYGIIRQISQVLKQDKTLKLNIIGHTDTDGDEAINLSLSQKRAASVKNALISVYKIDKNRLNTEGKGETMPISDNNTIEGKSENRRVEFVKMD